MAVYAFGCTFAVAMLVRDGALGLIWIPGAVATALFALQAAIKRAGRMGRLLAEIISAFGLTVVAMAAWAVAAGRFSPQAVVLWLLNGLFATNQILYVQLRIQEARTAKHSSRPRERAIFMAVEAITAAILLVAWRGGWIPLLALLAFLPILTRGGLRSIRPTKKPLRIHRLGKSELAHATLFGLLIIVAFRLFIP